MIRQIKYSVARNFEGKYDETVMKSNKMIVTRYKLYNCGVSLRIALVTDMHESNPETMLCLLKQEHPDVILIAGDLLERHKEGMSEWTGEMMDAWQGINKRKSCVSPLRRIAYRFLRLREKPSHSENAYTFLREAGKIAPVCYSVGNHEWYFLDEDYRVFEENKITLLDNRDITFAAPDGSVLIGGLSTRYDLDWLKSFSEKPGYKILLCHHPEYYSRYVKGTECDTFDLILSGHVHGGQWRIFGKGVFAPGQGFFPKYSHGMYDGKLIVSAGASNTVDIPRFGNPCELVMIECNKNSCES